MLAFSFFSLLFPFPPPHRSFVSNFSFTRACRLFCKLITAIDIDNKEDPPRRPATIHLAQFAITKGTAEKDGENEIREDGRKLGGTKARRGAYQAAGFCCESV